MGLPKTRCGPWARPLDGVVRWARGAVCRARDRAAFTPPWYPRQIIAQFASVGFLSLPVVGLTAWFTGAALALNIYSGGDRFNAETVMPQIVALGITRELGRCWRR
jgi:phospholipid/cholesterol/gamma-HCH transport system permease protein